MPELAPILVFCFERPLHLRRVLESLAGNPESARSHLILRMDGPPQDVAPGRRERMESVRALLRERRWCGTVEIHESSFNKGLAASVIEGVSDAVQRFGRVIVLEDDLECAPFFLRFMNNALEVYKNENRVAGISGYIYPIEGELPETFFLRGADCWGWATWKRGWDLFRSDGAELLREIVSRGLESEFDFDCSYPYTRMLQDQVDGKNDSWAIRWYASAFLAGKYSLYPGRSLVQNIGIDGSGTHSGNSERWHVRMTKAEVRVEAKQPKEDRAIVERLEAYFRDLTRPQPLRTRILKRFRRLF